MPQNLYRGATNDWLSQLGYSIGQGNESVPARIIQKDQSRMIPQFGTPVAPKNIIPPSDGPVDPGELASKLDSSDIVAIGASIATGDPTMAIQAIASETGTEDAPGTGGWFDTIQDFFVRATIIILGFIFVAVGLSMFKGGGAAREFAAGVREGIADAKTG